MRYISTRGGVDPVRFSQAVMMGLATDGGLLLPNDIPEVDSTTLGRWASLPFRELAVEVMLPFVAGDLGRDELSDLVNRSYTEFDHAEVTPLVEVDDRRILELGTDDVESCEGNPGRYVESKSRPR